MPSDRPEIVLVSRCFVKREDGKLLALKRASTDRHLPGLWECPGGKLDKGQDLYRSQEREVMEETGYLVEPTMRLAAIDSYIITDEPYKGMPYVVIFSLTHLIDGAHCLSDEHDESRWVSYYDFMELELTPQVRKAAIVLEAYLR